MITQELILDVRNLNKVFTTSDNHHVDALRDFSIKVRSGELVSLMGPNGSGKSTLFHILSGQFQSDGGRVIVNNQELHSSKKNEKNGYRIAHVPQNPQTLAFPNMTLSEHLLIAEKYGNLARFWRRGVTQARKNVYRKFLQRYDLYPLAESINQPLKVLSGGWQQIFIIMIVIAGIELHSGEKQKHILLLDEPTSALDITNTRRCLELILRFNNEGYTIMVANHDLNIAREISPRICMMNNGTLIGDMSREETFNSHQIHSLFLETQWPSMET